MSKWQRAGAALLVFHGIVCILAAFFPFHPVIFLFYWFVPAPVLAKLFLVLLLGAAQVVFGGYWVVKRKEWHVRWYWLTLAVFLVASVFLIIPAYLHGWFQFMF